MAEDAIRKELDTLKEDIAKLRTDIGDLTSAIKSVASEKVSSTKADAQRRAQGAWEDIESKLDEVLNQGRAAAGEVEDKITAHPAGSVLTAFGIGFIIAKLLDMRGRH